MNHLSEVLMAVAIIGGIGGSVVLFTKTMTDYMLKKKMVEKGFVNEDTQAIFKQQHQIDNKYSSLKWGLIAFFGGVSLIIMEFVPVRMDESPLPYGLLAVSISLGFLIYYFIVKRNAQ